MTVRQSRELGQSTLEPWLIFSVIINPAFCFQTDAANALVLGMGDRVKQIRKELHFIQVRTGQKYINK